MKGNCTLQLVVAATTLLFPHFPHYSQLHVHKYSIGTVAEATATQFTGAGSSGGDSGQAVLMAKGRYRFRLLPLPHSEGGGAQQRYRQRSVGGVRLHEVELLEGEEVVISFSITLSLTVDLPLRVRVCLLTHCLTLTVNAGLQPWHPFSPQRSSPSPLRYPSKSDLSVGSFFFLLFLIRTHGGHRRG